MLDSGWLETCPIDAVWDAAWVYLMVNELAIKSRVAIAMILLFIGLNKFQ